MISPCKALMITCKKLLVIIFFLFSSSFFYAYSQVSNYQRVFEINNSGVGNKIISCADGGFVIVGGTFSIGAGVDDVYMIKLDSSGNLLWTKTFGGTGGEKANSVVQTSDGGYIIAGWTTSIGSGIIDVLLIKTDENGNKLWAKAYGGSGSDEAYSVQQTTDNGYIIAGSTNSFGTGLRAAYLIKTDSTGSMEWTRTYGGAVDNEDAYSVLQTTGNGYLLVGSTRSYGEGKGDVYVIRTDSLGDTIWVKTYGGSDWDVGRSVKKDSDGGFIITGYTYSFGALNDDAYLLKIDSNGALVWANMFGRGLYDDGWDMQVTPLGDIIVVGTTDNIDGLGDIYMIKTDMNGNLIWSRAFGGDEADVGYSVASTSGGGFIISGESLSFDSTGWKVYVVKVDSNGNSACNEFNITTTQGNTSTVIGSASLLSAGGTETNDTIMVDQNHSIDEIDSCDTTSIYCNENVDWHVQVYPNPVFDVFFIEIHSTFYTIYDIELIVFDVTGRKVGKYVINNCEKKMIIDVKNLQGGVYFIELRSNNTVIATKKILKI